jgi:hypothetical protein
MKQSSMAKIIPFGKPLGKINQAPMSQPMLASLMLAYARQKKNIPINEDSINGSFSALIARGFVSLEQVTTMGYTESVWQVSNEAIDLLKDYGYNIEC